MHGGDGFVAGFLAAVGVFDEFYEGFYGGLVDQADLVFFLIFGVGFGGAFGLWEGSAGRGGGWWTRWVLAEDGQVGIWGEEGLEAWRVVVVHAVEEGLYEGLDRFDIVEVFGGCHCERLICEKRTRRKRKVRLHCYAREFGHYLGKAMITLGRGGKR